MSVLIKGMDKPKRCVDCPIYFAGLCSVRLQNGKCPLDGRPDWCPLEDVPAPHGRLIDADDFNKTIEHWHDFFKDASIRTDKARRDELSHVQAELLKAPTVIEEEQ